MLFGTSANLLGWSLNGLSSGANASSDEKPAVKVNAGEISSQNTKADKKGEKIKKSAELSRFMRKKLGASTQILEGLCTEDYKMIAKGAAELKKISTAEKWRISSNIMYRQHSNEFQRTVSAIEKAAKERKLETAALQWMNATLNCVNCHRFVRGTLIAR